MESCDREAARARSSAHAVVVGGCHAAQRWWSSGGSSAAALRTGPPCPRRPPLCTRGSRAYRHMGGLGRKHPARTHSRGRTPPPSERSSARAHTSRSALTITLAATGATAASAAAFLRRKYRRGGAGGRGSYGSTPPRPSCYERACARALPPSPRGGRDGPHALRRPVAAASRTEPATAGPGGVTGGSGVPPCAPLAADRPGSHVVESTARRAESARRLRAAPLPPHTHTPLARSRARAVALRAPCRGRAAGRRSNETKRVQNDQKHPEKHPPVGERRARLCRHEHRRPKRPSTGDPTVAFFIRTSSSDDGISHQNQMDPFLQLQEMFEVRARVSSRVHVHL